MAKIDHTIHVKIQTYDPAQDAMVPVPDVTLLCEHDGWLYNPNLYEGSDSTNNDGVVSISVSIEEGEENEVNPFFTLKAEQTLHRNFPATSLATHQFSLTEEWVTWHFEKDRLQNLVSYSDPSAPLEIFFGLDCHVHVSYTDFDSSQRRNPFALPQETLSIELIDQDSFLGIDVFAPDDHLKGVSFHTVEERIVEIGDERKHLPYADTWPTVPCVLDSIDPPPTDARIDPPDLPIGSLGGGSFAHTGPLAVDIHGFVFMVDGDDVKRFYPDGRWCETIGGFSAPKGIALDRHRHLFVADTGNNRLVCYELDWSDGNDGIYKQSIAITGAVISTNISNPGGLTVITDARIDGEDWLAVANTGSSQIKLYQIEYRSLGNRSRGFYSQLHPRLSHLANFGTAGNGAGQFQQPIDIAADSDGRLFMCDQQQHRVSRWRKNPAGTNYVLDQEWMATGSVAGNGQMEFDTPVAISVDSVHRYVYVVESGNTRVQRFDADSGNHLSFWQPTHTPALANPFAGHYLAVSRRGDLYLTDNANERVLCATVFDENGNIQGDATDPRQLEVWTPEAITPQADDKKTWHFAYPEYLTFVGESLWVSDTGNGRLIRFDIQDGELHPAQVVDIPAPTGTASPRGLVMTTDGTLYVADSLSHQLLEFDTSFTLQNRIGSHGSGDLEFDEPKGVDLYQPEDADSVIYIADTNNDRVKAMGTDGSFIRHLSSTGSTPLDGPEDIAVRSSDGHIFIADTGNHRIVEFDDSGTFVEAIIIRNSSESFSQPCSVSLDFEGHLLVADRNRNAIYRIEASGLSAAPKGHLHAFWNLKHLVRQQVNPNVIAKVYYPELEKHIVMHAPHCAVMNKYGLLCIADRNRHRVRLIRAFTPLAINSFEPGTGAFDHLPDIYVKTQAKADWSENYGIKLEISDVGIVFDDLNEYATPPRDNFSDDHFHHNLILGQNNGMANATNVMRVVKQVQRWYRHFSREDQIEHRWGHSSEDVPTFKVDLTDEEGSGHPWHKAHINVVSDPAASPIHGPWDNRVIAHEMTHWINAESSRPQPPYREKAAIHHTGEVINEVIAITEGYAEYAHLFWGSKYGSSDRLRGYRMSSGSGSLTSLNICTDNCDEYERSDRTHNPHDDYLFGGNFSAASPNFTEPGLGLRSEGYFANNLYQIHHALVSPEVLYADSPNYWYRFNAWIDDQASALVSRILRQALRDFPEDPSDEEWRSGSSLYFRQVLQRAHTEGPELAEIVQTINELNNQLMPVISRTRDGDANGPGSTIGGVINMNEGDSVDLTIQITDATGRALSGYQAHIHIDPPAKALTYTLPGVNPDLRHGRGGTAGANDLYHITNANGIINLTIQAPPGSEGNTDTITVSYQPDFDIDAALAPPEKGDSRFTVMRKWYLYELRAVNKLWAGTGNNFGSIVSSTTTVNVVP